LPSLHIAKIAAETCKWEKTSLGHPILKLPGGVVKLDDALAISPEPSTDLVAVDDALNQLAKVDDRKSQVVVMRFFGGLSVEETAEVLKVSPGTVARDWRLAKAWLMRELSGKKSDEA
jgi:RNA polymerase sigma-70 factor (ECF subfamily)